MRNQPKYNFINNTRYAIQGLKDIIQHESSFKIELILFIPALLIIFWIDVSLTNKLLMFSTYSGILIAETINSAIERIVDLVTLKHHEMAGRAKDAGSAIVFLSIVVCSVVWLSILFFNF
ncbi:MAG: diacylglycerol kinase [Campylobacterota bacterium]|nr:diacylglycerol kinase [Campylobacterota bacterium]